MLPCYATAVTTPPAGDRVVLFIALFVPSTSPGGRLTRGFRSGRRSSQVRLLESGRPEPFPNLLLCGLCERQSETASVADAAAQTLRHLELIFILRCGSERTMSYSYGGVSP